MFVISFIGSHIRSMIAELERLSGRQFPQERLLPPDDFWGVEKRMELSSLIRGKVSAVESFRELTSELYCIESFLYVNAPVEVGGKTIARGYEEVRDKYFELLNMRWLIATDKHKSGLDTNSNRDWKIWAYGMIEVDQNLLDDLRHTLNETESRIRNTPLPDHVDRFRLDYLDEDLRSAGIPLTGLSSPQPIPTPENDSVTVP